MDEHETPPKTPETQPRETPPSEAPRVERRSGQDRRQGPTPWLSRFWLRGRRRGGRRAEDRQLYVDRYQWSDVLLVTGVVVLCAADTVLTLKVLERGAVEANPLMNFLIQQGTGLFGAVKLGFTLLGMLFLLTHIRLQYVRAATLVVLVLYTVLMFWHLWVSWDMHQTIARAAGS